METGIFIPGTGRIKIVLLEANKRTPFRGSGIQPRSGCRWEIISYIHNYIVHCFCSR